MENWPYVGNGEGHSYCYNILLITNRKWHILCQTRWKSLTLDDLEGHWQPVWSAILVITGLLVTGWSKNGTKFIAP